MFHLVVFAFELNETSTSFCNFILQDGDNSRSLQTLLMQH